ncbi:hypothetical protein Tco_0851382 [Tanacetum coccineum]
MMMTLRIDENKDAELGSLETRTEEMQTPIPTTPRSPRTILSLDTNITHELTDNVSLPTTTTSKNPHSKRHISSKCGHLPGALRRMCRRQGYMIQNMERKCITTKYFWKTHKKVDRVLHEIVPQLAERATGDLIENNLKPFIAATIIEDRDAFRSEVHDLVSQEFNAQAPKIIEELFKNYVQSNVIQVYPTTTTSTETTSSVNLQQQLYLKMKRSLQDQANDPVLDDDIHSQRHDDHQEDDAPPEGEKRVKRHKASKSLKSAKEETVIDEDEFKNAEEYTYHLEQATNFMENQIVWESKQEDIRHQVLRPLIFFGPQRNPNEPLRYLYNKYLFFLKNGNTKEKKHILSLHKIHAERFSEANLEEKINRWVRKEFKNFNEDARLSIQH